MKPTDLLKPHVHTKQEAIIQLTIIMLVLLTTFVVFFTLGPNPAFLFLGYPGDT